MVLGVATPIVARIAAASDRLLAQVGACDSTTLIPQYLMFNQNHKKVKHFFNELTLKMPMAL